MTKSLLKYLSEEDQTPPTILQKAIKYVSGPNPTVGTIGPFALGAKMLAKKDSLTKNPQEDAQLKELDKPVGK